MKKKVLLVGAFHELVELCNLCDVEVAGIFDRVATGEYHGCEILGDDQAALSAGTALRSLPVVLSPDQPSLRRKLAEQYGSVGFAFSSLISPLALVSKSANLGIGVVIQSGCNISSCANLGDFVRVNTGAIVMHDTSAGAFTTIAPSAVVLGRVRIGDECYVGANSTILPNRLLGKGSVVGAGAVVTRDVPPGVIVSGVPARQMKQIKIRARHEDEK